MNNFRFSRPLFQRVLNIFIVWSFNCLPYHNVMSLYGFIIHTDVFREQFSALHRGHQVNRKYTVSEIKVLFCAFTGCTSPESVRPGISLFTLYICSYNNWLKKRAHTKCTPLKIVHPAVNMCAPGAGCTLNF